MDFQTLNLRNNVLIEFLSENLLIFLSIYRTVYNQQFRKELLITEKKKNVVTVAKPTCLPWFENKKRMI